MNTVEDTGERRRVIDHVSTDDCLELVCTLAYENALRGGNEAVVAQVETAMLKLRSLKTDSTVGLPIITPATLIALEDAQGGSDARIKVLYRRLELAQLQYDNATNLNGISVLSHLESKMKKFAVELRGLGEVVALQPGETEE